MRTSIGLFAAVLVAAPISRAASPPNDVCAALDKSRQAIYGFRPPALAQAQHDEKSKLMDAFWDDAKKDPAKAIPCLRAMLQEESADPFFLFDASALLFGMDQTPETLQVVLAAVSRSDLNDLDPAGYIRLVMRLARHDIDTGPLAEKYLRHRKVDTYLAAHGGMKLERISGAILLYGSMESGHADRSLAKAVDFPEVEARAVAIFILAHSLTEASFAALSKQTDLSALPAPGQHAVEGIRKHSALPPPASTKYTRERILARLRAIANSTPDTERDPDNPPYMPDDSEFFASAYSALTPEDLPLLREVRRKSMRGVSDEALYEYFSVSRLILGVINRYDLSKEYRVH